MLKRRILSVLLVLAMLVPFAGAALNDLYIETRYPTDLPFEINEVEIRRYLDMAERMFAAIRRQLYAAGRPHPIEGEEP